MLTLVQCPLVQSGRSITTTYSVDVMKIFESRCCNLTTLLGILEEEKIHDERILIRNILNSSDTGIHVWKPPARRHFVSSIGSPWIQSGPTFSHLDVLSNLQSFQHISSTNNCWITKSLSLARWNGTNWTDHRDGDNKRKNPPSNKSRFRTIARIP